MELISMEIKKNRGQNLTYLLSFFIIQVLLIFIDRQNIRLISADYHPYLIRLIDIFSHVLLFMPSISYAINTLWYEYDEGKYQLLHISSLTGHKIMGGRLLYVFLYYFLGLFIEGFSFFIFQGVFQGNFVRHTLFANIESLAQWDIIYLIIALSIHYLMLVLLFWLVITIRKAFFLHATTGKASSSGLVHTLDIIVFLLIYFLLTSLAYGLVGQSPIYLSLELFALRKNGFFIPNQLIFALVWSLAIDSADLLIRGLYLWPLWAQLCIIVISFMGLSSIYDKYIDW